MKNLITLIFFLGLSYLSFGQFSAVDLHSEVTQVQPMTGIVFWSDNSGDLSSLGNKAQLEFSYLVYSDVIQNEDDYDWSIVDNLLAGAASDGRQMIIRFRYTYPGVTTPSVPDYIRNSAGYQHQELSVEGSSTYIPDWSSQVLEEFTKEFFTEFAARYDNDPRLAFLQIGFGSYSEYHLYNGPLDLGQTFPSKAYQTEFLYHVNGLFQETQWGISIDAASSTYTPIGADNLQSLNYGLFDDSFLHENHSNNNSEYNRASWLFFGADKYETNAAGGELNYYSNYDQQNVLSPNGPWGTSFEELSELYNISYMIGNDQLSHQSTDRIESAGMATGYRFSVESYETDDSTTIGTIRNTGIAPIYYDAYPSIGGTRSNTSLKGLLPNEVQEFTISTGAVGEDLEIECDRLSQGQVIQFDANIDEGSGCQTGNACNDGDTCTTGETYDVNCNCTGGTFQDADGDGVCDANDICPTGDDNIDTDGDGIPDACDNCATQGQACNDNDICTTGETYDASCNCTGGTFQDADGDGVCTANDPNDNDPCNPNDCSGNDCIAIDQSLNDWSTVALLSSNTDFNLKVADDDTTLYISVSGTIGDVGDGYQIFLDTDDSASEFTYYSSWAQTGFDAMIENGFFSTYTGTGNDWTWSTETVIVSSKTAAGLELQIDKSLLNASSPNIRIGFAALNNWAGVAFLPTGTTAIDYTMSSTFNCGEIDCIDTEIHAYLEGPYDTAIGEMTTVLSTRGLLPGKTPLSNLVTPTPAGQPYSAAPWNYAGTEGADWTDADYTINETDWILVSFRTGTAKSTEVAMTAALLMKDGSISFPNRCALTPDMASSLYVVIEHRNHIGVMTPQPVDVIGSTLTYDFRSSDSYRDATSFGQKQLPTGEWVLYAGDADQSDFPSFDINGTDKVLWFDNNGVFDYYLSPDFNLDGDVNGDDKLFWFGNNGISSRVPK